MPDRAKAGKGSTVVLVVPGGRHRESSSVTGDRPKSVWGSLSVHPNGEQSRSTYQRFRCLV